MDEKDIEQAEHLTDMLRNEGLYNVRAANAPESHPDFDGVHCVDCTDDIPPERLALRRVRCVLCQGILEKRQQRRC